MGPKLAYIGGLLAVSAWAGIPVGGLIGLLSSFLLWLIIGAILEAGDQLETLGQLKLHVGIVTGLWFGSGVGSRLLSGGDWQKIADWYLASLFLVVALLVGPLACIAAYKIAKNMLRAP